MSALLLLLLLIVALVTAELPTELDPFLEKLFEYSQCEDFVSNSDWVSVATKECSPNICDFPRQLCQREASKFRDSSANQCRFIPQECVTAANGGVPLPEPTPKAPVPGALTGAPFAGPLVGASIPRGPLGSMSGGQNNGGKPSRVNVTLDELCRMESPVGRFCGFVRKWTYNRETGSCDNFWFPGCKTKETNANLFETKELCEELALLCREKLTTTRRLPSTTTPLPTFSPITLPPSPLLNTRPPIPAALLPPPSPAPSAPSGAEIFGQRPGSGEFGNNIVSLIANGIMGGRGGPPPTVDSGSSKAAQALNVLSQFTNFEFGNLPSLFGQSFGGRR